MQIEYEIYAPVGKFEKDGKRFIGIDPFFNFAACPFGRTAATFSVSNALLRRGARHDETNTNRMDRYDMEPDHGGAAPFLRAAKIATHCGWPYG